MIGGKTRAQLNDKMIQAVNTYLSTQRVPAISQDHNVDIFSRLHTQGMTLHSVRYVYTHIYIYMCLIYIMYIPVKGCSFAHVDIKRSLREIRTRFGYHVGCTNMDAFSVTSQSLLVTEHTNWQ